MAALLICLVVRFDLNAGLGFGVIHPTAQIFPIRDQHGAFGQVICPCIAWHGLGLADDVKLAIGAVA